MFTGIIQGQGEITSLRKNGTECRLAIRPLFTLTDVIDGESIAVNGACLSVAQPPGADVCPLRH